MSRHTKTQIEKWEPVMKATFYHNKLKETGLSVGDLAENLNLTSAELRDSIAMFNMYSIACSLSYSEDIEDKVKNPRDFNITNLTRIYEKDFAKDFLGISIDEDGEIKGHIAPKEFKKGLKKIVVDIAKKRKGGGKDSRDFDKPKDIENYLYNEFEPKDNPDLSKGGSFTSKTLLEPQKPEEGTGKKKKPKRTNPKKKKPAGIIPRTIPCTLDNERIIKIFDELTRLSPAGYPNASAILLRSLLELSVSYYLTKVGEIDKMRDELKAEFKLKSKSLPRHWVPTLKEMLVWIAKHENIIKNSKIKRPLNKIIQDHLFDFNLFTHFETYNTTEDKLREIWSNIEEFMKIILTEPEVD